MTVINGSKAGKSVLITSAIHGCEYLSIEAVFRLAENTEPQDVAGQIIIINPVNVDGFLERRPYIIPQDGKNLNRLFPGNHEGTLGDKIAYLLTEEFQKLGEIRDLFGNVLHEYYAKFDGVVLMVVATLAIKKGDALIAYGN